MKKLVTIISILLVVALLFAGCGTSKGGAATESPSGEEQTSAEASESVNASAADQDGVVIKFIAMSTASVYWSSLLAGAEAAAEELGDQYGGIEIQFDAPESDTDMAKQIDLINNAVSAGVDGLLVAPSSPTVPHDAIVDAVESGVYVICVDQYLDPMDANAFYGTNGVQACKDLAEYMVENVLDGDEGSYGELVYNMTSLASIDRHDGFVAGMEEFAPGMTDIGYEITDSDIAATQSMVANMIQANPDLKVLFANNDRSALGTLNALKQDEALDIKMCNVDCNLELLQAMRQGTVQAMALQMPYNQGYEGVKMLLALMNGEEVPKESDSGSFILTQDNMDTDEAVAAIRQYIEGYEPADSQV